MFDILMTVLLIFVVFILIVIPMIFIFRYIFKGSMWKNAMYKDRPSVLYNDPFLNHILMKVQSITEPVTIKLFTDRFIVGGEFFTVPKSPQFTLHAKDLPVIAYWYKNMLMQKGVYEIHYIFSEPTSLRRPHLTLTGYAVTPGEVRKNI